MQLLVDSKGTILTMVAFLLFWLSTTVGYQVGTKFGFEQMLYNFGEPRDLYPLLFAYVSVFTGYFFAFLGIVVSIIFMRKLGRKFNVPVFKPTLFGLALYIVFSYFLP